MFNIECLYETESESIILQSNQNRIGIGRNLGIIQSLLTTFKYDVQSFTRKYSVNNSSSSSFLLHPTPNNHKMPTYSAVMYLKVFIQLLMNARISCPMKVHYLLIKEIQILKCDDPDKDVCIISSSC